MVISGPSGVGKSTVVKRVLEASRNMVSSTSLTTRSPREAEKNGKDYFFVSRDEFIVRRDNGELLEWAEVHGNLYGTLDEFVNKQLVGGYDVLLEIDVQGGLTVKEKRPETLMIFLMPPSRSELEKRLRERRTDNEDVIVRRLANAGRELEYSEKYEYQVVNDSVDRCMAEVIDIIGGRE